MFPSQPRWRTLAEGVCSVFQRLGCPCSPKGYFTGWGTPADNALSAAPPCSFQGLLECFIPKECGCHSSSQMENPCWRWLWIQSTALGYQPRPFIGMRSWVRARRGKWSSGSFHSRWGTEWGVWPHYSLAEAVLCALSFAWVTVSSRKDPDPCGFLWEVTWAAPSAPLALTCTLCSGFGNPPFSQICVKTSQAEQEGYSPFYSYWFAYLEFFWILLTWQFKVKKQLLNGSNGIKLRNVPCPTSVQVNKIITGKCNFLNYLKCLPFWN